jgi:hypothetical protein
MQGSFSKDALDTFDTLVRKTESLQYSETYDFTRCVRSDGSSYGTGGTCRKGKEGEKVEEEETKKPAKAKNKEKLKAKSQEKLTPQFSYLRGKDVPISALDRDADSWRNSTGLAIPLKDPNDNIKKHDRVHILFHEFLGGTIGGRDAIGKWLGTWQKSPTVAEEVFIGLLHEAAQAKAKGKSHTISDEELGKKIAQEIKDLNVYHKMSSSERFAYYGNSSEPNTGKFIKKFREFENNPNYETLLDAANAAFPKFDEALK